MISDQKCIQQYFVHGNFSQTPLTLPTWYNLFKVIYEFLQNTNRNLLLYVERFFQDHHVKRPWQPRDRYDVDLIHFHIDHKNIADDKVSPVLNSCLRFSSLQNHDSSSHAVKTTQYAATSRDVKLQKSKADYFTWKNNSNGEGPRDGMWYFSSIEFRLDNISWKLEAVDSKNF